VELLAGGDRRRVRTFLDTALGILENRVPAFVHAGFEIIQTVFVESFEEIFELL